MTGYIPELERIYTYRKGNNHKKEDNKMKNGWHEGTIGIPVNGTKKTKIARFWVKTASEASEDFGIDGGRIIKLQIKVDGYTVVNYDRGWDIEPDENDAVAQIAYAILVKDYN